MLNVIMCDGIKHGATRNEGHAIMEKEGIQKESEKQPKEH
jgi:hypothetical protein